MSSTLPRQTLNPLEKYKLEEQFGTQVPEFNEYYQKKKQICENSWKVGAVLGVASGIATYQKTHQVISGLCVVALGTLVGRSFVRTVGGHYYGMNPLNDAEYERAFNLWVYYEHNPHRKQEDLPVHTMEARYQKSLNEFRETHKKQYEKFLTQQQ